ncbi:MAG: CaiB/BaiF CoA transferase family protein [Alphaproteobacteria bacterium]
MPHQPASTALSRFTVIDLTRVRAGPTCVRQFADWGANVIKVELPEALEEGEGMGGDRHGSDFQNLHRNKRAMTLNLKDPEGRAILEKLVAKADVLVENYRPDVKHRLGIDYDALRKVNKRLVYASISGFGQDGPYAKRPGFDQVAQGMGGLMSITGLQGQGPVRAGIPIADLTAGLFAALGILTALHEREVSGEGQWLETSLLAAQVFMLDFQASRWTMDREVPKQAGNDHPTSIPTGVFKTADGHINIAAAGGAIWLRLCDALGMPDMATRPGFATSAERSKNRIEVNRAIEAITVGADSATWITRLNAAGVPCGEINSIDKVFADPQVKHLGLEQTVHSLALGDIALVAQPVKLKRTPSSFVVAPPERGEHTREILADLGYTDAAIDDLARRNIV